MELWMTSLRDNQWYNELVCNYTSNFRIASSVVLILTPLFHFFHPLGFGFGGFGLGGKPTNDPSKNPFGSVPTNVNPTSGKSRHGNHTLTATKHLLSPFFLPSGVCF